ncbi:prolyl oligopeptidase family serine peptidase [Pseudoflavitalea sp. G-6-1-2]|uniref:S9 family peptidase n=1 Tax=Pseudoflavitalea sp. G-6-1-2 TaxID=2728841 RepID=UPI00146EB821|nr:S9 family peptidase [Pseudoflavitalea sp. G-6-1-2]NML20426.1 prolyl oligopeptidase family serine peptidase [Pseudoflavitalea sp. G-6-1-2]
MNKKILSAAACFLLVTLSLPVAAQKKQFSSEQLLKNNLPANITKPLPTIRGWVDDEHYIEVQRNASGEATTVSVDVKSGKAVPYTAPAEKTVPPIGKIEGARNITASPDGKLVAYTKADNNLYVREILGGLEKQLTTDGSTTILNGYASWVYYEEILGRASNYRAFWWSPNSKQLCFMRSDESMVPVFPIYVISGQDGYLENTRYPKAGEKNPEVKIGIVNVESGNTTWADFNQKDDQYFGAPIWSPNGQCWVQWMNRDQNDLKLYNIDLNTGAKNVVYEEQQKTWIVLEGDDRVEFLPNNKGFIVKSDKDGWENLYYHDITGKLINQITTGNFWKTEVLKFDEKSSTLFIKARKENSARYDLYKIGLNGKGLTRLSFGDFSHDMINVSPTGKYFITTYSNLSTPYAMALVDGKGKTVRMLGDTKGTEFDNYAIPRTELVRVKSADGLFELPVTITYPINFDPAKKYPILVSIYGGPDAGTVYDRWKNIGGYTQWWAQEGLVQVAIDNRASGHFGKNGLNYIYRQLGKYEIEDFMAAGRWLKSQPWADANKLAMTGGSFGGYMTCMAMTYGSDVYDFGIANASVTDWQFYDTHYTERFMDTPQDNAEGYKNTAVMAYANKYKGLIRIVHGTSDDNVHFQNSLVLIDKMEELGKHFEFMAYPGERHNIGGNSGKKRAHRMAEEARFWYENLLGKPVPAAFK